MSEDEKSLVPSSSALEITDIEGLERYSQIMAQSKMFPSFQTKAQAAAAIEMGRSLGIEPVIALQTMAIVKGRVCIEAKVIQSLMERDGVSIEIIKSDDKGAKLKFEKPGKKPYTEEFTIDEAKAKGFLSKDNWKNWPGEMCYWRCLTRGGRKYSPGSFLGIYATEEMDEDVKVAKTLKVKGSKVEEEKPPEPPRDKIKGTNLPTQEGGITDRLKEPEKKDMTPEEFMDVMDTPVEEIPEAEIVEEPEAPEPGPEPTQAELAPPAEDSSDVAWIKGELGQLWGNRFEDQFRLFKVFLLEHQKEKDKHFVGTNSFGHLSFNVGKAEDIAILAENERALPWTVEVFLEWKKKNKHTTFKKYEKEQASE